MITATRYHDFSYGHVVLGHEGKCAHLHGHNGRVHFTVTAPKLDHVGRVLDFNVIKHLADWVEVTWDHKFLIASVHPMSKQLFELDPYGVILVSFNPTAENMALYLLNHVGPALLEGTETQLIGVSFEETRKCSAEVTL